MFANHNERVDFVRQQYGGFPKRTWGLYVVVVSIRGENIARSIVCHMSSAFSGLGFGGTEVIHHGVYTAMVIDEHLHLILTHSCKSP